METTVEPVSIILQAVVGLLIGGICGFFIAIKTLPYIGRNFSGVSVGFDLTALGSAFFITVLGILGGAVVGLFTALWLTR